MRVKGEAIYIDPRLQNGTTPTFVYLPSLDFEAKFPVSRNLGQVQVSRGNSAPLTSPAKIHQGFLTDSINNKRHPCRMGKDTVEKCRDSLS